MLLSPNTLCQAEEDSKIVKILPNRCTLPAVLLPAARWYWQSQGQKGEEELPPSLSGTPPPGSAQDTGPGCPPHVALLGVAVG